MPATPPLCGVEMPEEMSNCSSSNSEENPRHVRSVRLFGVDLLKDGAMRKSASLSNLSHYAAASPPTCLSMQDAHLDLVEGYVSDGLVQTNTNARARRKGVPWTEDEHRLFLVGLQKLGKGDWRGISKNFVTSRTPTQVASHAQKYFIRQSNLSKRKRRSSLFDISPTQEQEISLVKNPSLSSSFMGLGHDMVSVPVIPLEKILEEKVFFPSSEDAGDDDDSATNLHGQRKAKRPSGWEIDRELQQELEAASASQLPRAPPPLPPTPPPPPQLPPTPPQFRVLRPVATLSKGPLGIDLNREFPPDPSATTTAFVSLNLDQPVRHSAFHVSGAAAGIEAPIRCT